MKMHRHSAPFVTLSLIAMLALVSSCSNKSTNPVGGGTPAKELDSGDIATGGGQYAHPFATEGTFSYHCNRHSTMAGSVIVGPGSPMTRSVTITDFTFSPSPASVAKGGTVTWTNNGSLHTVTSN